MDDKIISDRSLDVDREEREEERHARELPPEDRDAAAGNTGSLLSGDALSGSGDAGDAGNSFPGADSLGADDTTGAGGADDASGVADPGTSAHAFDAAPATGGADVGADRDRLTWDEGEPTDEDKRVLSEEVYYPANNALKRY